MTPRAGWSKIRSMSRNLKEVFQEAARLPERDRATLAGLLIETLDPVSELDVEGWTFASTNQLPRPGPPSE